MSQSLQMEMTTYTVHAVENSYYLAYDRFAMSVLKHQNDATWRLNY